MSDFVEAALMPFRFPFMQNAFLITVMIAIPAALLSAFLVLKGWSLMGDAVSHAVLPGVVLSYMAGTPYILGAFVAGMICALATGWLKENGRVKQDTVMGVVFSGMFGFGIVLYAQAGADVHLDHILFGNMLGVGPGDLWTSGIIGLFVTVVILLRWRDILVHAFDPVQAQVSGLPVRLIHYGLLALLSLTIVGTLSAVGIILAIALLIGPGAIAFLLTRRMAAMLAASVAVAVFSGVTGVYLSFFIDSAPAPTIVLVLTGMFILAFVAARFRGAVSAEAAAVEIQASR